MKAFYRLPWLVVLLSGTIAVSLAARAYSRAKVRADTELTSHATLAAQEQQLAALRPVSRAWEARHRPESGLAARLGEALASAGLPASALASVTPQPETAVQTVGHAATPRGSAAAVKRQRASVTLAPITLPQVGAFLEAWRVREPYWTVAGLNLSPEPAKDKGNAGGDLPLRVVVTLDAVYLDKKGDGR